MNLPMRMASERPRSIKPRAWSCAGSCGTALAWRRSRRRNIGRLCHCFRGGASAARPNAQRAGPYHHDPNRPPEVEESPKEPPEGSPESPLEGPIKAFSAAASSGGHCPSLGIFNTTDEYKAGTSRAAGDCFTTYLSCKRESL